jgi:uncharacterized protein
MQTAMIKSSCIDIGRLNMLEALRESEHGLYLQASNGAEVLLPKAYVDHKSMPAGGLVEVFVYTDSEDRPVATTQRPKAMLDETAYFQVLDYRQYGAFVDWGLPKDLFVPLSQQKEYFTIGKWVILRVCLDAQTGRLYGTQKIGQYFERELQGLRPSQSVETLIIAKTPMGYKVLAEGRYEGMLFENEIFEPIEIGERKRAYIKALRYDGKLDLSLQPLGRADRQPGLERQLLERLAHLGGRVELSTKSDPDLIVQTFGMSKKSFKRAFNALKAQGAVGVDEKGIWCK